MEGHASAYFKGNMNCWEESACGWLHADGSGLSEEGVKISWNMQGVLRNDGIHHSIFPVQSWSQIKAIFADQINEGEVSLPV